MTFIERSSFGVRASVYELRHPTSPLQVVLCPMVHVAEPAFYTGVAERLRTCTAEVLEGVPGGLAYYLTLTYRLLGQLGRLGLASHSARELLTGSNAQIIPGDVTRAEFQVAWKAVPHHLRLLVLLLVPVVGLLLLTGGSREILVPRSVEDLPSREDILDGDERTDALDRVLAQGRTLVSSPFLAATYARNGGPPRGWASLMTPPTCSQWFGACFAWDPHPGCGLAACDGLRRVGDLTLIEPSRG